MLTSATTNAQASATPPNVQTIGTYQPTSDPANWVLIQSAVAAAARSGVLKE